MAEATPAAAEPTAPAATTTGTAPAPAPAPAMATATSRSTKRAYRRQMRVEKNHVGAFLVWLAVLDAIVLGLAASALNKSFDGEYPYDTSVAMILAVVALLACTITAAAIMSGWLHFKHYNSESVAGASTLALVAWAVTLVAFGLACKLAHVGDEGSKLKALEAFVIILAFFETLYLLMLHAGLFSSKYGVGY